MFDTQTPVRSQTLLRHDAYDEIRLVTLAQDQGGNVVVTERSDGAVTMAAFGTLTHVCQLSIPASGIAGALRAIGHGEGNVGAALSAFFAQNGSYLSDLQDLLDATQVSYGVAVWNGSEAAYRAPLFAKDANAVR